MSTNEGYFCQKDELAMGSPPAPLLANIWLFKHEPLLRDDAKLFERYMDDVIRSIQQKRVEQKLVEINQMHPKLKFTMEVEEEGQIPFLDMLLVRTGGVVSSTWYCKPTDTGLVMNFHAIAPMRYKKSVISGFVYRIHRACSSWSNFHDSLEKAKSILEKNQYPPQIYNLIIENTIEKLYIVSEPAVQQENDQPVNTQQCHRIVLQYRGPVTDKFVKRLKDSGAPVQAVMTLQKLRSYMPSLKVAVTKLLKSRVVYKLSCPRCSACYVSRTSRHLLTRFNEHRTKKTQPVLKHFKECGLGKPTDIEILASASRGELQLATLEALYIREVKPALNTKDEFREHELTVKI